MTIREAIEAISNAAMELYGEREAQQIGRIMVMELGHYTPTQIILSRDEECQIEEFSTILEEVKKGRPMQYIIGTTEFCDLQFKVQEGVLIPRPETEELVRWITEAHQNQSPRIADIGTGSGAIAVSLSKLLPQSEVWAVDISPDALAQAKENNRINNTNVNFVEGDALQGVERFLPPKSYDIIVSNPPYIPQSEVEAMRKNVVDFEPHLALFVEDSDPLIFYRVIAISSAKLLTNCGKLYFEIHEDYAKETVSMLQSLGYQGVECRHDINEKPRMICAQRP